MGYKNLVFELIAKLSGPGNILSVNRIFCRIGGLEFGLFVSQLLYWCDKGRDRDGWFYKSYKEWEEEIFIPERTLRRLIDSVKELGWLETKVKRVGNNPTLHYRIDQDGFCRWIVSVLPSQNVEGSGQIDANHVPAKLHGTEGDNLAGTLYTSITTPNTQELQTTRKNRTTVLSGGQKINSQSNQTIENRSNNPRESNGDNSGLVELVGPERKEEVDAPDRSNVQKIDQNKPPPPYENIRRKAVTDAEIVEEDRARNAPVLKMFGDMAKQAGSRYETVMNWAKQYKTLDSAVDYIKETSYVVWENTGFVPHGSKSGWSNAISTLYEACGSNEQILIQALKEGEKARREKGLIFSGPRSYLNFARNALAIVERDSRPLPTVIVDANAPVVKLDRSSQGTGRTVTLSNGKVRVDVN